jgi:hypothetical protein
VAFQCCVNKHFSLVRTLKDLATLCMNDHDDCDSMWQVISRLSSFLVS